MRTRNSSSIGPDDTTTESHTAHSHMNDSQQQQQPLLPPPPPTTARAQHGRRPPPVPPPVPQQQQIPPIPPVTNRPSEVIRRTQPPPSVSQNQPSPEVLNVVTSPQPSPTRTAEHQQHQQRQRPPPVLSPLQRDQYQHHSPSERLRTTVTAPPPTINTNANVNTDVSSHRINGLPPEILMPSAQEESIYWILQVRLPSTSVTNSGNSMMMSLPHPIRKVQMTSGSNNNMDVNTLSNCLQQCLNYYPNNNNNNNNHIAGLFCEATHTFYSLQHILSWDNTLIEERKHHIYAVELPVLPPFNKLEGQPDEEGFWMGWYHYVMDELAAVLHTILLNVYILLPIVFAVLFYYQYNIVTHSILLTYTTVYSTMIEQPLRDIYHYGPWFIGWEGDDISTICARITYHGDAQFWIRNMSECQRIYSAKEQAFIRIVLPFIYIICIVLFVYTIRFLIQEYQNYQFQLHNNHRNPLERDMAELYNSFHVILRQILQVHNNQQRATSQQKHRPK
jgi:hypothetical protein